MLVVWVVLVAVRVLAIVAGCMVVVMMVLALEHDGLLVTVVVCHDSRRRIVDHDKRVKICVDWLHGACVSGRIDKIATRWHCVHDDEVYGIFRRATDLEHVGVLILFIFDDNSLRSGECV